MNFELYLGLQLKVFIEDNRFFRVVRLSLLVYIKYIFLGFEVEITQLGFYTC